MDDAANSGQHRRRDTLEPLSIDTGFPMAEFDVDAMLARFAERAAAVKDRPLPPVAGAERKKFIERAEADFTDYSLVANAKWSVEDGHLVLRIPLAEGD